MDNSIFYLIISNLCTGGLSWLFTLRFTRREAEAGAMAKVQEVYRQLIEDINADRDKLKEELGDFKLRVERLEKQVGRNESLLRSIRPSACAMALTCDKFILKEIPEYDEK